MAPDAAKRILLVEDNEGDARLLREMLRESGSNEAVINHVEKMADAEVELAERGADIILVDLGLPDADGLTAVRRARRAAPGIPIVVLTGLDDSTLAIQALQEGAQDYLVKGQIDTRGLLRSLRYAVERKLLEEAHFAQKERAEVTLQCIGDGVICTDGAGRLTFLNVAAEDMTGSMSGDREGSPLEDVVRMVDRATCEDIEHVIRVAIGEDQTVLLGSECLLIRPDGREIPIAGSVAPIHDHEGRPTGAVIVFRDVSAAIEMAQQVARSNDLIAAKEAAESADMAKSAFLSRMSHELRTPLNAILGFAQLLEAEDFAARDLKKLEHILKAGRHLLGLIDEVLDISRMEAGKMSLSCEPVCLAEVISDCADMIRPMAVQEGISLFVEAANDDVFVRADRQRLKQVVLNLLSNAVKYNHPEGEVTVSWTAAGDHVMLDVADTGLGMSAERTAALYTPFERLGAENTTVPGTGLGLAVSKRLVEAMDGLITVESAPDVGTTFTVDLPGAVRPAFDDVEADPRASVPHSQLVVYIEDNLASVGLVEQMLARRPTVKMLPAMSAGLGLELARVHRPDLILMDLDLPDMAGDQLLAKLTSDVRTRGIPVAVITGSTSPGRRRQMLASGATMYLTKPIDLAEFDAMLERLIGVAA